MKAGDFFDDPPPQRETATTTPLAPTAGAVAATGGPLPTTPSPETRDRRQDAELVPPPARRPPPQPRAKPVLNMRETRRDTSSQADDHQPNRIPDSETQTQQTMDLQEQPEPFTTAPALSYTDLRPPTNTQMSDSLLRRSLLLHRKPMLVWKRRKWCWEGANSLERREDGRAGRELRGSKLRRSGPAQKTMRPRAASRGHQ